MWLVGSKYKDGLQFLVYSSFYLEVWHPYLIPLGSHCTNCNKSNPSSCRNDWTSCQCDAIYSTYTPNNTLYWTQSPPPPFSISNCNSTLIFTEQLLSKYTDKEPIKTYTFDVPCLEKTKEHGQDSNPQTSKTLADALPLYHDNLARHQE